MAETPAKRQKVDHDNQASNDPSSFEDFAPDGDVVLIVEVKTRVRVDSVVMKRASSVFAAMLGPNFKEGHALAEAGAAPIEIPLPEDNAEEFGWICRALHCQGHTKLWKPNTRRLVSIWSLIDKYDLKESMQLSFGLWTSANVAVKSNMAGSLGLAFVSLLTQDKDSFKVVTRELILRSTNPVFRIVLATEPIFAGIISGRMMHKLSGTVSILLVFL
jgi:hypothetical protein